METTNPATEVAQEVDVVDRLAQALGPLTEDVQEEPEAEPETEPEAEQEPEADGEPEGEPDAEPEAAPTDEEVEFDGERFKLPPKVAEVVKKADSLQADYTRKTQEVAETKRIVEDKKQYLEAQELILQHAFTDAAEVQSIQAQLQQFDALDWKTLVAEDAQKALQLNLARQQLQSKLTEKQQRLQQIVQQAQAAKAQHTRQQMELGMAEVQRRIGKVDDKVRQTLLGAAREYGMAESHLMDPVVIHALSDAAKWRALQQSKPQVTKKVQQAKAAPQPSARSTAPSIEQARWNEQRQALKKTGRQDVAASLLTKMLSK